MIGEDITFAVAQAFLPVRSCEINLAPARMPVPLGLYRQEHLSYIGVVGIFYSRDELVQARAQWKAAEKTVVFTNGCYDLLHPGHIRLLEKARSLGDVLILALNSDASVRRLKGPSRPLTPERERADVALELQAVDAVVLFNEDTPRELIAAVLPDILVKGADWAHWIAGREEVEAAGGKVMALSMEPGYSTTDIVETILAR
ncbi:MAG: cytidyltransferase-related domain [Bryobacterales bacterium]|nr:cytidyltransferase-related domain [Bryobacterales bacterium]